VSTTEIAGDGVGPGRLWFGLLGGPVAWTAHLMLAYTIGEFGCLSPGGKAMLAGLTVVTWLVLALTALTLALAVGAAWVAYRIGQRLSGAAEDTSAQPPKRYLADAGLYLSGTSAFIILVESLPLLYYLRDC
jgi:hypothetical protein